VSASLLDRVRADGAAASIPDEPRGATDAVFVVERLAAAAAAREPERALALWDEAGERHDVAAIDVVLQRVTSGAWIPFFGVGRRRRLRDSARRAVASTTRSGTIELAAAVLGAVGTKDDVDVLETLARHPAFTLHAATALSNLAAWQGRAALLRLLTTTDGDERVTIIDRLLPHVREPAVRLALVRDALRGLAPEHAVQVAGDIAAMCTVQDCLDDPTAPADVKAGARLVLAHARPAT
jgi:hypothetical protein